MRSSGRTAVALVAVVVVLSMLGKREGAALVGLFGILVTVLLLAVARSRPGGQHKAWRITFLARYGDPAAADGLPGVVVAALATGAAIGLVDDAVTFGALAALYVPVFVMYLAAPQLLLDWVPAAIGFVGTLATIRRDDCLADVSDRSVTVLLIGLVVIAVATIVVRVGLPRVPRVLRRTRSHPARALMLFGAFDVAVFVIRPNGLEIWADAPGWAAPVVLGLVAVIAVLGSFAPELVLALLAIGAAIAQLFLAGVEHGLVAARVTTCDDPTREILWAAGFVGAATTALWIGRPGSR